ncbi:MAG: hypothetical protein ABI967_08075 [bacterium]
MIDADWRLAIGDCRLDEVRTRRGDTDLTFRLPLRPTTASRLIKKKPTHHYVGFTQAGLIPEIYRGAVSGLSAPALVLLVSLIRVLWRLITFGLNDHSGIRLFRGTLVLLSFLSEGADGD